MSVLEVPFRKGGSFFVDAADRPLLEGYAWHPLDRSRGYVAAKAPGRPNHAPVTLLLHRHLMKPPKGLVVDHIDGNGYNNTRANLRVVTHQVNHTGYRRLNPRNTSGVRGIQWYADRRQWCARIVVNGEQVWLWGYDDINDAAQVRREAELRYYGEPCRILGEAA